jgi:acyl-CoA thioester hydrolase
MTINLASIPPDGRHRYAIRVYYEDTDAGGVVYHANYLRYAERARTEALRDLGVPHADLVERFGVMFMVRSLEVDYERGARLDDALTVETEVLEVGGATTRLRQTVRNKDAVCAVLTVRLACVRLEGNRPGRIPPLWRERLMDMRSRREAEVSSRAGHGPRGKTATGAVQQAMPERDRGGTE